MKKRILSMLLAIVMVLGMIPTTALAADRDMTKEQVHVIVENTTFPTSKGAPWDGVLVDTWITLGKDSTMMSCVADALKEKGYEQEGAENNYIKSIEKLAEKQGGENSGWMGTLNDWFTDAGYGDFTVANGRITANDEIRVMYTCAWGADIGSDWDNTSTLLKKLDFSAGSLDKAFTPNTKEYSLTISDDVTTLKITPTAENKNFQVHTRIGNVEYKRTQEVPVTDGSKIEITCGEGSNASVYVINVVKEQLKQPVTAKVDFSAQFSNYYLFAPQN